MLLQHLTELAERAHNWTSFSPERRGKNLIAEFSNELQTDIDYIESQGQKYGFTPEQLTGTVSGYAARFEKHFTAWLYAKSNCMSSMIAGPANFPVRKAEKANNAEHAKYLFLTEWRERCKKAIVKGFKPKVTPLTELETAKKDLEQRVKMQEHMKICNAIIRKAKGKDCTAELVATGIPEHNAIELQKPDWCNRIGFASYQLTNNNANIKRLENRVKELEAKAERHSAGEQKETAFKSMKIIENFEADRLQLVFEGKPSDEIRAAVKKHGFKWAPSQMAWQRKLTNEARFSLKLFIQKHSELLN